MADQKLIERLRRVGMKCFVKYYEHADDPALAHGCRTLTATPPRRVKRAQAA